MHNNLNIFNNWHGIEEVCFPFFQEAPVEPYSGGPPTYGTERGAAPPTYDEATG